jgi:hypothetical protein
MENEDEDQGFRHKNDLGKPSLPSLHEAPGSIHRGGQTINGIRYGEHPPQ